MQTNYHLSFTILCNLSVDCPNKYTEWWHLMGPLPTSFAYEIINISWTVLTRAGAFWSPHLIISSNSSNALGNNILSINHLIICSIPSIYHSLDHIELQFGPPSKTKASRSWRKVRGYMSNQAILEYLPCEGPRELDFILEKRWLQGRSWDKKNQNQPINQTKNNQASCEMRCFRLGIRISWFFSLKGGQAWELTVLNLIPWGFQDLTGESPKQPGLTPELPLLVWAGGVTTDLPKSFP